MAYSSSSLSEQDTSSSLENFLALSASDLYFSFLTLEISESFSSTTSKELERFNQDTIVYSGSATRTYSLPYSTPRIPDSSQGRITPTLQYLVYNEDENNYNYYMMYKNQKYDLDNAMEMRNKPKASNSKFKFESKDKDELDMSWSELDRM
ncbi:hypothetical protein Tco_0817625 [Tanacetum coccineum]